MSKYFTVFKDRLWNLLAKIRASRCDKHLNPAERSFQQGWQEAMQGEIFPVSDLWTGIDAE